MRTSFYGVSFWTNIAQSCSAAPSSSCNQCKSVREKCHCVVPVVPDSPFCCYTIKGKWQCEYIDCCVGGGCGGTECVRYYIEFEELSCCQEDGSELSGGLSFFTGSRFNRLVLSMKPQFLPFLLDCKDECDDCDKPRPRCPTEKPPCVETPCVKPEHPVVVKASKSSKHKKN